MSNNISTFWELISNHRIEIPTIQRDYAQGRDNPKSAEIRSNFITQIKGVLAGGSSKPLHLNFIYGKINGKINEIKTQENKEAVKSMLAAVKTYSRNLDLDINWQFKETDNKEDMDLKTSFIPLDGQQRLTTLFLIHTYLMPEDDAIKNTLKRFTYKIRPSSRMFCEKLVDNIEKSLKSVRNKQLLSETIKDASWFFQYWIKDPTVSGMLNMLDEIHLQFKDDTDKDKYWERLNRIQFNFLDLEEYKLTDELYVKMNARGVPLTPFENFKAWLIDYIQKEGESDDIPWTELIDTSWADLFWDNKDTDNMLIDEELMRFFRNMFQIFLVQQDSFKSEENDKEKITKQEVENARKKASLLATDIDKETGEYYFIPNSIYSENNLVTKENLNKLFLSIDNIEKYHDFVENSLTEELPILFFDKRGSFFKKFIDGKTTYKDKVVFYALLIFVNHTNFDKNNSLALRSWLRVIRNLVLNSTIDNISQFKRAINTIKNLGDKCLEVNNYLAKQNEKLTLSGFKREQVKEEILKAKLICENPKWENELLEAENHPLFRGQIEFILRKLDDNQEKLLKINSNDFIYFQRNKDLALKLWNENGADDFNANSKQLLIRTLLSMDFPIQRETDLSNSKGSWRKIFRNNDFRKSILKLLSIMTDKGAIKETLDTLIKDYPDYLKSAQDSRSFLIKEDNLLKNKPYIWHWHGHRAELRSFRTARAEYKRYFIFPARHAIFEKIADEIDVEIKNSKEKLFIEFDNKICIEQYFWWEHIRYGFITKIDNPCETKSEYWKGGYKEISLKDYNSETFLKVILEMTEQMKFSPLT